MTKLQVDEADSGVRLDVFLANRRSEYSRSYWQQLIDTGEVLRNGAATKSSQTLLVGDEIKFETDTASLGPKVKLPIIFEDENLVAINKPHGLLVHPVSAFAAEQTVVSLLGSKLVPTPDSNHRPGVVHRLDRDTSGVMVLAKTVKAQSELQQLFANRQVDKIYRAVVVGEVDDETAKITFPIGRDMTNPAQFRVDPNGKPAETEFKRLNVKNGLSYLELHPKTGRTHQLRVHLSEITHPILGDQIYGKPQQRLMLHAAGLEFALFGHKYSFTASLPEGFTA